MSLEVERQLLKSLILMTDLYVDLALSIDHNFFSTEAGLSVAKLRAKLAEAKEEQDKL